jgi:hypothetical protein
MPLEVVVDPDRPATVRKLSAARLTHSPHKISDRIDDQLGVVAMHIMPSARRHDVDAVRGQCRQVILQLRPAGIEPATGTLCPAAIWLARGVLA